jgi:RNA polymerase sigma-70 factor, ECF subfamily
VSSSARIIPLQQARHATLPGLAQRTDEELMELVAGGVAPAFAELVRRRQAAVRLFCTRWSGEASVGDELAQEVFLDVWRSRERYKPRGRFAAWLFTLARNRCRSERRSARRPECLVPPAPLQDDQLDAILCVERQRRIDERVRQLPAKLREALMLRFNAALEYDEISRIVGAGESTVRSRVFLAVSQLREWAGEDGL